MSLAQRLGLRQTQTLALTQRQQQSLKLLQLANLELATTIADALERNPLLRHGEAEGTAPAPIPAAPTERIGTDRLMTAPTTAPAERSPLDTEASGLHGSWSGGEAHDEERPDPTALLVDRPSLRDHLAAQIALELTDPADRLIAAHLIDGLDDAGYLALETDDLAVRLGTPVARVEAVLAQCRKLNPSGLFARSLAECLAIQLAERDRLDPAMQTLLDHLDRVARRDIDGLVRLCGVGRDDVVDMIREIRALDPKPGAGFADDPAPPRVPDLLLHAAADGGWHLAVNDETLPKLLIDRRYQTAIGRADAPAREFVRRNLSEARWLIRALDQRATTLLKVGQAIVTRQDGFFRHGVTHLRPMLLRDVADDVGLHESTVSRAVADKAMATPRGLFDLKFFFTQAVGGGDMQTAEAIKHRIREMIEAEPPEAALSDDQLVLKLRSQGVDIARRTVAKYREALRIPSSARRKREKEDR
jgi:RNA polymerase sigma-54 factor